MSHPIPALVYGSLAPKLIQFDYPPIEDTGEMFDAKNNISDAVSGLRQVSNQYTEATRRMVFSHISEKTKAKLELFFRTFGCFGNSFKYYDDKAGPNFLEYELLDYKFIPKKIAPVGPGLYIWEVPLSFRRVAEVVEGEEAMSDVILNNQSVPLAITGFALDHLTVTGAILFAEVRRSAGLNEVISNLIIRMTYRNLTGNWAIEVDGAADAGVGAPPSVNPSGVTFSTNSLGQLLYTSDNMIGAGYSGSIYFKKTELTT